MQGCANLKSLCSDRNKMQIQNKEGNKTKSEEPLKSRDQKVAEVRVDAGFPDILIFRQPCSYQKVPLLSY